MDSLSIVSVSLGLKYAELKPGGDMRILLPVDGSSYTIIAAKFVASHLEWLKGKPELHLLHVKLPLPLAQDKVGVGKDVIERYYREEAEAVLAVAVKELRKHHIEFISGYKIGDIAEEIRAYSMENKIDLIVIGSHGLGSVKNLLMGSVATKVIAMTDVPILIVR